MLGAALLPIGCALQLRKDLAPEQVEGTAIKVRIGRAEFRNNRDLTKFRKALTLLQSVVNSRELMEKVLLGPSQQVQLDGKEETDYCVNTGERCTYAYNVIDGQSLTNRDVWGRIASPPDWELNVRVNRRPWALWCGWPFVREIGHREQRTISTAIGSRDEQLIVTQDCHLDDMDAAELAGHWAHEYLHIRGFDHPYKDVPGRSKTVPYFVGDIIVELASQMKADPMRADP